MRTSIGVTAITAATLTFLSLGALVAAPADLDGEWSTSGKHSKLGAYTGWVRITVAPDKSARVHANLRFSSGKSVAWDAVGTANDTHVQANLVSSVGASGAISGATSSGGVASYNLQSNGKLSGIWQQNGGATEVLGRVSPKDVDARADEIEDLADGWTSSGDEKKIVDILRNTPPLARKELLRKFDLPGAKKDLPELVFHDVDDAGRQKEILDLIREADFAAKDAGRIEVGIISDIDDTAIPTKFKPDGPDFFAGAADLYKLIELGQNGQARRGDLHYLTARPIAPLIWHAKYRLNKAGMPMGTFSQGNLAGFIFHGLDGTEKEKISDGEELLALHPAQKFVCFGDTLERDPEVYRALAAKHPDQVVLVLIHKAGGNARNPSQYPGQVFFDTYAEAQNVVRSRGLIK